jgi:hypothetical protein
VDTATRYTDVHPDGRPITLGDIQPGWWIQVYVGNWPCDTVCGYVTAIHGGGAVTARLESLGTTFVKARRIASTLRPVLD